MESSINNQQQPKTGSAARWTGRILTAICVLFLFYDGLWKAARSVASVSGTAELGFADSLVRPMGMYILFFTALYCIPRTALLGALLLTAHLGGAVAVFVQQFPGQLFFLFPLTFCVMLWAGLYLRDPGLRPLLPFTRSRG